MIQELFNEGYRPKEVSEKLNIPYNQVIHQRRWWLAKQRGFKSPYEYQKYRKLKGILEEIRIDEIYGDGTAQAILEEYKLLDRKGLLGRRSLLIALGVVAYATLRKQEKPVILNDISKLFGIDEKSLKRSYMSTYKKVGKLPVPSVESYVERGINDLPLSEKNKDIKELAIEFYESNKDILRRFRPNSVSAVLIYIASKKFGINITQEEVGKSLGVSKTTIWNILKVLREHERLKTIEYLPYHLKPQVLNT